MLSARFLLSALALAVIPPSCIIVKETVPAPESAESRSLRDRVSRLEARMGDTGSGSAERAVADSAVGEVTSISSSGGLVMLRLRPGSSVAVGSKLAVVGNQGFKGLLQVQEIFEETSVGARPLDPVPSTAEVGDRVLIAAYER